MSGDRPGRRSLVRGDDRPGRAADVTSYDADKHGPVLRLNLGYRRGTPIVVSPPGNPLRALTRART
jgi:hypothetical protein